MMRFVWCAVIGTMFVSTGVFAQSAPRKNLRGHVPSVVSRLQAKGHYDASDELHLAIGLPLRNETELGHLLHDLYDPGSPNYHKYLTPEEFTARFGPTEADYEAVKKFAEANGLKVIGTHANRVVLDVSGSVGDIERAFHTTLRIYSHPTEQRDFVAPEVEPSVPASVPVVDVSGLSDFGRPKPMAKRVKESLKKLAGSGPSGFYAGNDFRNAYAPGTTLTGAGQTVGLLQFDGYNQSDIVSYQNTIGRTNYVTLQNVLIDNFKGGAGEGNIEVCLDIETSLSMAPGLTKIIVYEGNPKFPFFNPVDVVNRIATDNLAKQVSSSWTWSGGPNASVDAAFRQMAAQGQSYFQASGDSDAYTGSQLLDISSEINSPVASTNVTAVGGTSLVMNGAGGSYNSESVWNWNSLGGQYANIGSSGGVSTYYSIPPWQAVLNMTANLGSTTMRNVPDVALTGDDVYVVFTENNASSSGGVGGTSCAAPLWAGFTALINQQSMASSGTTVGFVNPAIYALGMTTNYTNCFHDTTVGDNIGTNTPGLYPAVPGYDLATGWGSPNGTNLINALAPRPYIIVPPGSKTNSAGNNVTFNVVVGGLPPFSYRWLFNGTNLSDGGNISGATTSTLTLNSIATSDAGNYRVVITNTSGSVTSSIAILSVPSVATNHAPNLSAISNKTVNELATLTITNSATDADTNALTFTLEPGAPAGANITTNGVFSWTPTEAQGPSTNSITVRVTDNGSPALSDTKTFSVVVNEVNVAPALNGVSNKTVNEGVNLSVTNAATDADLPANTITYSLGTNAPSGSSIHPATGVFTWTPSEAQGPGVYSITVIATDNGVPVLTTTNTFSVTVNESNAAPVLDAITTKIVHAGMSVVITNHATDPDLPTNTFTFSLTNSPVGMSINAGNGTVSWTPTDADAGSTNSFTVKVSDSGSPNLSDSKTGSVVVMSRPTFLDASVSNGVVTLTWTSIAQQLYGIQFADNLTGTNWLNLGADVLAVGTTVSTNDLVSATNRFYRIVVP